MSERVLLGEVGRGNGEGSANQEGKGNQTPIPKFFLSVEDSGWAMGGTGGPLTHFYFLEHPLPYTPS